MSLKHEFRPNIFQRILFKDARKCHLLFSSYFFSIQTVKGTQQISYDEVLKVDLEKFLIWSKIKLKLSTGVDENFGWITSGGLSRIIRVLKFQTSEAKKFNDLNDANALHIETFNKWYLGAVSGEKWVTYREIDEIIEDNKDRLNYLWQTNASDIPMLKGQIANHIRYVNQVNSDRKEFRSKCNFTFEKEELKRYESFFDNVLLKPLTIEQRKAVVVNEDAELVVAAAGSGKTTTIKSKVAYLVHKGMATPNQILVISFNKNVQQDLEKSLSSLYPGVNINTFHALGLSILGENRGQKPSLTELAESREKLGEYLDGLIKEIFEDRYDDLAEFFVSFAKPYRDQFDFKNMGEYIAYVRSVGLITFNGESVKSLEELEIANFLFSNGVNYLYEQDYEHAVASTKRRQYKPDFYLPDFQIYIEHFAIDINGKTPPFINEEEYLHSREWKILTHQQYKTTLVQTFSHEKRNGTLTSNLRQRLELHGVIFSPRPKEQLLDKLNSSGYISELGILLATFLNLFKGSLLSLRDLSNRLPQKDVDSARAKKFIEIFGQIYQSYERHLASTSLIDFNDMIRLAEQALVGGFQLNDIKYVLIDEFQDISIGRAEFIKALLKSTDKAKLLAVGDDWQSIYRFSGSDISVMTCFEEHFGRHEVRMLSETFRFDRMVESVASRFVLKNDAQIKKKVVARSRDNSKSVILWHPKKDSGALLESIIQNIPVVTSGKSIVLILARYNFYKDQLGIEEIKAKRNDLQLIFSSVHAAKGAEEDYAILVVVKSGRYSFPSEIADDPLLDLVLSVREHFEHAEERRLLYVALTRTKNTVYVVGDPSAESTFFNELTKDPDVDKTYLGNAINRRCLACQAPMAERNSKHGLFFGCSNYPICDETSRPCIACGSGFLVRYGVHIVCDNPRCNKEYEACPECEDGMLVQRDGKYGLFLGCTNYSFNKCDYSQNMKHYK